MTQTIQLVDVEHVGSGCQYNGTGLKFLYLLGIFREDCIRFTNLDQLINIAALIDIDRIGMRYCLGIPHTGWRTVIETRGETNTFGKLIITIPACRTFFKIDVSGFGN